MTDQFDVAALLSRISGLCLALPDVERQPRGRHADFRVRTKPFAYFLDDHHGNGIVSICCRSTPGDNVDRAGRDPDRFYLPAYIGKRGWFGIRLNRDRIDWGEVELAIEHSWRLAAPRTLVERHDARRASDRLQTS